MTECKKCQNFFFQEALSCNAFLIHKAKIPEANAHDLFKFGRRELNNGQCRFYKKRTLKYNILRFVDEYFAQAS